MKSTGRLAALAAGTMLLTGLSMAGTQNAVPALAAGNCVNMGGTGGCFSSIQAGLNAAGAGATVRVAAGHYTEDLMLTKPVSLIGAGSAKTIIDASSSTPAYGVVISRVHKRTVIRGFTVENAPLAGIQVRASSHVILENNTVQGNDKNLDLSNPSNPTCNGALPFDGDDCGEGINLNGAVDSIVKSDIIQSNAGGILMSDEYGKTHGNLVENNTVQNNALDCGITLASHPHSFPGGQPGPGYGVYNNLVEYNASTNNGAAGAGIFTPTPGTKAYDNTIAYNILSGNGNAGLSMHSHAPNQDLSGNKIIGNWIGLNNIFGDPDAGNMKTTGILVWTAVSPLTGIVIKNNTIVGGNHFGIWVVGPIKSKIGGNHIYAAKPIYIKS